jgi:RNA-directed DNA polymerase
MEQVVSRQNMLAAYHRVVRNAGAAGVDGISVDELGSYCTEHWETIRQQLLEGTYRPQPVRAVAIPKPGGGERVLGIPTVIDRMIQQAVLQILTPMFDPHFSEASYGFRPGRSAHGAVARAREHIETGHRWVVDIDLERFFDRVNHDVLIARVAKRVRDKRVLQVIGRYLRAGLMQEGVTSPRREGTPQGGPLSPLLSNILLDDLDRELERRGHRFVRYADDCNIYVRSRAAGERVMASLEAWLAKHLRLRVNRAKSAVERPWKRTFLGYSVTWNLRPRLKVAAESVRRMKTKLRQMLRRGRGRSLRGTIATTAAYLRGWMAYFSKAEVKGVFEDLDKWLRRKLRRIVWKQWKRPRIRMRELQRRGVDRQTARRSAYNGRGPWFNAGAPHMHLALPTAVLAGWGLPSLIQLHQRFSLH